MARQVGMRPEYTVSLQVLSGGLFCARNTSTTTCQPVSVGWDVNSLLKLRPQCNVSNTWGSRVL